MKILSRFNSLVSGAAAVALAFVALSCSGRAAQASAETAQVASGKSVDAVFDADSAYSYIKRQCDFGPRVPGSQASRDCARWLVSTLGDFGASDVTEQRATVTAYDGTRLDINNISARFNPEAKKRILLLSHWDSRPWADHDPDEANHRKAIDGANDGASGVGVILEIARNISKAAPRVGVDVLFVDAEDYGVHNSDTRYSDPSESSWCLGTQHWVMNPTINLREISYAVLLDMVGGRNAEFAREYFSQYSSSHIVDKVWKAAGDAGYGSRFVNAEGNPVVDDHIQLLKAGVPAIDIIECTNPTTGCFNPTWHTMADTAENIDKATLKAVGQTLLQLLYTE